MYSVKCQVYSVDGWDLAGVLSNLSPALGFSLSLLPLQNSTVGINIYFFEFEVTSLVIFKKYSIVQPTYGCSGKCNG